MFFKKKPRKEATNQYDIPLSRLKRVSVRELVQVESLQFMATHLYDKDLETGKLYPPLEMPGVNSSTDKTIYEIFKHKPEQIQDTPMKVPAHLLKVANG
ncbi:MAG: hypothetical protein LBV67_12170 [Streptococcaceae bacterium]|jgi:hypothetical protein|nr:hypothetical protein [Streptococcaceae bacterium]